MDKSHRSYIMPLFLFVGAHICHLNTVCHGNVVAWGVNNHGRVTVPQMVTNAIAVAAGDQHSIALLDGGGVAFWGLTGSGQNGISSYTGTISAVSAGWRSTLGITGDGGVRHWGFVLNGSVPMPTNIESVVSISAYSHQYLIAEASGRVKGWGGHNQFGQVSAPSWLSNVVSVSSGFTHGYGLSHDGKVFGWGDNSVGQLEIPSEVWGVAQIASGDNHGIALRIDGRVVAWGNDGKSRTNYPGDLTNIVWVAAGGNRCLALTDRGVVRGWDALGGSSISIPAGASNVTAAACSFEGAFYVAMTGYVPPFPAGPERSFRYAINTPFYVRASLPLSRRVSYQWQRNGVDISSATSAFYRATESATGVYNYRCVMTDGAGQVHESNTELEILPVMVVITHTNRLHYGNSITLTANTYGGPPSSYLWFKDDVPIAGATNSTYTINALRYGNAGTYRVEVETGLGRGEHSVELSVEPMLVFGASDRGQNNVSRYLTNVIQVAAGREHILALDHNGKVSAWGGNDYGQTTVPAISDFVSISGGSRHSIGLRANGLPVVWGSGQRGQTNIPVGASSLVEVSAGDYHNLAIRSDMRVFAWGDNRFGQSEVPFNLTNVVSVAAGARHSLALTKQGLVLAWGDNEHGQTDVPVDLSNAVALAAGDRHSLALRQDGTVITWGANDKGQLNLPDQLLPVVAIAAGDEFSMALQSNGEVVVWGQFDSANVPPGLSHVAAIAAGGRNAVTLAGIKGPRVTQLTRTIDIPAGLDFLLPSYSLSPKPSVDLFHDNEPSIGHFSGRLHSPLQEPGVTTNEFVVSNSFGSVRSAPIIINSLPALAHISLPSNLFRGQNLVLQPTITSSGGLVFQWFYNGVLIRGETNSSLNVNGLGLSSTGIYSVAVANSLGSVTASVQVAINPIVVWGDMSWTGSDHPIFNPPTGCHDAVEVKARNGSAILFRKDKSATSWGEQSWLYGEVYDATVPLFIRPNGEVDYWVWTSGLDWNDRPKWLSNAVEVVTGAGNNMFALRSDGSIQSVGWSEWYYGRRQIPQHVLNQVSNVVQIVASYTDGESMAALKDDGSLVLITENGASTPLGLENETNTIQIASVYSQYLLGLRDNGTVFFWSGHEMNMGPLSPPSDLSNVVAIAGGVHALALKRNGTVQSWGFDNESLLSVPRGLSNVVSVAADYDYSVALLGSPEPVVRVPESLLMYDSDPLYLHARAVGQKPVSHTWYHNGESIGSTYRSYFKTSSPPIGDHEYHCVVSNEHGVATSSVVRVKSVKKTVYAWGGNWSGEVDVPKGIHDVVGIATRDTFNLASLRDGSFATWGTIWNSNISLDYFWYGQIVDYVSIPGYPQSGNMLILANDGTVYHGHNNGYTQFSPYSWYSGKFVALATANWGSHVVGLKDDGTVEILWYNWGGNEALNSVPADLNNVSKIVGVNNGYIALKNDGSLYSWGATDNSGNPLWVPTEITNIIDIGFSNGKGYALRYDGRLIHYSPWIGYGEVESASNIIAISSGYSHTLGLRSDGTVTGWGDNWSGELSIPDGLSNVVAIAAGGYDHSVALVGDGPPHAGKMVTKIQTETGKPFFLNVRATGEFPLRYQWLRNGHIIDGATNSALKSIETQFGSAEYQCVISNSDGELTTDPVTVSSYVPEVVAWGYSWLPGVLSVPPDITNVVALAAGDYHAMALLSDGTVKSWGAGNFFNYCSNGRGGYVPCYQRVVPDSIEDVTAIAAAGMSSYVLKKDGSVWSWYINRWEPYSYENDAVAISASYNNLMILRSDGSIYEFNGNWSWSNWKPMPEDLTNIIAISAGPSHSLAVKSDGTVAAWGSSWGGETIVPAGLSNVVSVTASWFGNFGLLKDGTVVGWNNGAFLEIPSSFTNVKTISSSWSHLLALRYDGTVVGLGDEWSGAASLPSGISNVLAVAAGSYYSLALIGVKPNVRVIQQVETAAEVPFILPAEAVGKHPVAIAWTRDDEVIASAEESVLIATEALPGVFSYQCIASNEVGESRSEVVQVNVKPAIITVDSNYRGVFGLHYSIAPSIRGAGPFAYQWQFQGQDIAGATNELLSIDNLTFEHAGTYTLILSNSYGTVSTSMEVQVEPLGASFVNRGAYFTGEDAILSPVIAGSDPFLFQWYKNDELLSGETNASLKISNINSDDAAEYRVVINNPYGTITSSASVAVGNVAAWGNNDNLQSIVPAGLTNVIAVAAGDRHCLALLIDKSLVGWGDNSLGQLSMPGDLSNVVQIAAGKFHSIALQSNGVVRAWGRNSEGQVVVPPELSNVVSIAAGDFHSIASRIDGTVAFWGDSSSGQSNGYDQIAGVIAVSGGGSHSMALMTNGVVRAWGNNASGQLDVPASLSNAVAIAAGGNHSLALAADGTITAWGANNAGQCIVPDSVVPYTAISAFDDVSAALRADGKVAVWGSSLHGQDNVPENLDDVYSVSVGSRNVIAFQKTDSDDDGISDSWEFYNGLNPLISSDASSNVDGSLSAMMRYMLDLRPGETANPLRHDAISATNGTLKLSIQGSSIRRLYQILWTTNLSSGIWNTNSSVHYGTAGALEIPLTNDEGTIYYRVRVRAPQ